MSPLHLPLCPFHDSVIPASNDWMQDRLSIIQTLKDNLTKAQNRMKLFQVGDMVYLKLQPSKQHSIAFRKSLKLAAKFYGPFKVIEKIGKVAYKLKLPPGVKVHPVFHLSLLNKKEGSAIQAYHTRI